jgi:DNA/RNA endonuclease G (NUC1)
MGMSTHVQGFRPPDEQWRKMKAVYDACEAAGIKVPDHVWKFFEYETPDANGVEVSAKALEECGALHKWSDDSRSGYEVDITKLPQGLTILRFYNSW